MGFLKPTIDNLIIIGYNGTSIKILYIYKDNMKYGVRINQEGSCYSKINTLIAYAHIRFTD